VKPLEQEEIFGLKTGKMATCCDYCKKEFKWSGKDYHLLHRNGFCSAECGNRYNMENDTLYRFCTNPDCGNGFYITCDNKAHLDILCDACRALSSNCDKTDRKPENEVRK